MVDVSAVRAEDRLLPQESSQNREADVEQENSQREQGAVMPSSVAHFWLQMTP